MKFRSLALTAVAACTLGLTACGGDDASTAASGDADAKTLLVKTFQPGAESSIKSAKIELKLNGKMTGSTEANGDASATVLLNESKAGELPEFKADLVLKGKQKDDDLNLTAGGTYIDGRLYVNLDGEDYDLGDELSKRASDSLKRSLKEAEETGGDDKQALIGQLGLQPDTWLTDPKVEGEEEIGGADAYKITGAVDIKAMVPDILDAARKAQSLTGGASNRKVPEVSDKELDDAAKDIEQLDVVIWTGKDDTILRKVDVKLVIKGDKDDKLDGTISLTLSNVNEQQKIDAPSNTKSVAELMPKLGPLLGLATGSGGAPSGGAGAAGAAGSPEAQVSQEFLDCVNAAAGDAVKLNACQSKLQP